MIGGVLPAALAANWLAAAWDQNSNLTAMSPTGAALGGIIDALGLDACCGGTFVTGSTMANFTGLAAALHALLAREGWNVEEDGLFGAYDDADSWSLDAHKWLNVNYDSGILLMRHAAHLRGAFTSAGAYLESGKLKEAGFEILNDVVSNQLLLIFGDYAFTRAMVRAIQQDGACWCGETVWHGRATMRISVSSSRTTEADVRMSVEAMVRSALGKILP